MKPLFGSGSFDNNLEIKNEFGKIFKGELLVMFSSNIFLTMFLAEIFQQSFRAILGYLEHYWVNALNNREQLLKTTFNNNNFVCTRPVSTLHEKTSLMLV